jgi:hypothetical protein
VITYYYALRDSEKVREDKIRTIACRACGARERRRCERDGRAQTVSCTGRYDAAADLELVPALPGMWGLQEPSRVEAAGGR